MQKTMIIMYNNLLKRILFPSLSIYFFPHFFPSPNPNFGASWEKMGIFSILKIESLFPSFHILFSPFLPIPKSKFRCVLGKNGVGPHNNFTKTLSLRTKVPNTHGAQLYIYYSIYILKWALGNANFNVLYLSLWNCN